MSPPQSGQPVRCACPACGRYLGTVDGTYFEPPPCSCGVQTIIRIVGRRLVAGLSAQTAVRVVNGRAGVEIPASK